MIGPPDDEIEEKIKSNEIRPLILELHPEHRGYTVTLPGRNCVDYHTRVFTYDDDFEFLQYVENNELPSILIDLIEKFCLGTVFYKGCVAINVREYRNAKPEHQTPSPEHRTTILRPTVQSLTDDLNRLLYDDQSMNFSIDQKNSLESEFWKLISKNLCFEKSIGSIKAINNSTGPSLSKYYERKRKRRAETEILLENDLKTFKFVSSKKLDVQATVTPTKPAAASHVGGQWKPMLPSARTPMEIAEKRLNAINEIKLDDHRIVVEEYLIEFTTAPNLNDNAARCFKTKIVISRRNSDWIYVGDLIMERGDSAGDSQVRSNFALGSEWQAQLYIKQYLDMVSEGGRRSLTLTRMVPGKPPQVIPVFGFISFETNQKVF